LLFSGIVFFPLLTRGDLILPRKTSNVSDPLPMVRRFAGAVNIEHQVDFA
jgi:hypothetical protein